MTIRNPIDTAPRDGTVIYVSDPDCGEFLMRWNASRQNPLVSKSPGIWEDPHGNFTWCEDHDAGPTSWRPCETNRAVH